ncbi:hypothetical protein COV17_01575 [Candidatus Woesearchaeota archaeon CG10_big_fil_rev_8_21_14_0_10_36_11]|nr:MAG: hypothetical protein COV17_01575 [Candidatus Woesearchaeota archaeon CG10_big_fil_rev_8_21_14_0_10_36_11]
MMKMMMGQSCLDREMASVNVLVKGQHSKNEDGKLVISSTVTLIKSNKNIIVDTGSFLDKETIIKELQKKDLTPESIDIVILTHLHLDHIVNTYLFKNAQVYCKFKKDPYSGQVHYPRKGCLERTEPFGELNLANDMCIISTPGHTEDMVSVVVDTVEGKVVIAGDAFPDKSFLDGKKQPDPLLVNIQEFNESRKKIIEIADFIVPGHGDMFKVEK